MSEQQPEAWIIVNKETGYRTQVSDLTPFLYHREIFEVIPLYTAPPKREPTTEPVAWMNDSGGCFLSDGNKYSKNWTALYTAPPTREPLSKEQYMKFFTDTYDSVNPITDFVRAIEKAHGIGGGE